jgi:ribonuclease G
MGVSRRITNYREKRRLKGILAKIKRPGYGLIARTVAQNKSQEQLEADLERLLDQWRDIESSFHKQQAPFQLHREKGMVSTMIRDMFADDVAQVVIDNKRIYKDVTRYLKEIQSPLVDRIKLHKSKIPIFDHFNLETEIEKLTSSKVWLNGGGYLIIESTEAMVTIDVNSGSYNRKRKIEDNILKVNLIAVKEICQQIRLRDLGGLIIIDFIDMSDPGNRKKVEEAMAREMSRDRAQWDLLPISKFGLMEMTRQRLRPELLYTLKEPCQVCNGTGMVPSMETMVTEIEQFIRRFRHQTREHRLELLVHKDLYDYLTAGRRSLIKTLMWKNFLRIKLLVDDALPVGRFAAVSPKQKKEITDEFST